ncbi:MAG TPA: tyrosine-type recombinase/integrase [Pyrinomonadaceae bacterium]|nr:tyrosine-type recombinase/integrase [Pyrinomonadaceae bacterium]HMP65050.1 tyrosine-type recombinase/integrase [Pyrinomonadaceae bacterium]
MTPPERRFELISKTVFQRTPREKTVKGRTYRLKASWCFRIKYKIHGRPATIERSGFKNKTAARTALNAEIAKLQGSRGRSAEAERKTFTWLAEQCRHDWLTPAKYRSSPTQGRVKISGLKSYETIKSQIERLQEFFGEILLDDIEPQTLQAYKLDRLEQYVMGKAGDGSPRKIRPVSLATVHRELALARRALLYAFEKGWIEHNPFRGAKGLIVTRHEEVRSRILSFEEQERLLAACSGAFERTYTRSIKGRSQTVTARIAVDHQLLRVLIVVAIETGFRLNELRHVRWQDLDEAGSSIWILPGYTKTGIGRRSLLTEDAVSAIREISEITAGNAGPFAAVGDIKRAWKSVKERAAIDDLHFHDLRATFASRTIAAGVPFAIVQKLLGHSSGTVTERHYIALDADIFADAVRTVAAYKKRRQGHTDAKTGPILDGSRMVN